MKPVPPKPREGSRPFNFWGKRKKKELEGQGGQGRDALKASKQKRKKKTAFGSCKRTYRTVTQEKEGKILSRNSIGGEYGEKKKKGNEWMPDGKPKNLRWENIRARKKVHRRGGSV